MDTYRVEQKIDEAIQKLLDCKTFLNSYVSPTALAKPTAATELVASKEWPKAVEEILICDPNDQQAKKDRSQGTIDLFVETDITGLKVLDYGCGEGGAAEYAASKAALSVGYDPFLKVNKRDNNLVLTNNYQEVTALAPFDVIILFDVIDHLINDTPAEVLKKTAEILKDDGKIYMRAHPFTSRHACHLHHHLNKAYLHLVFSDQELKEILPDQTHVQPNFGPTKPLLFYQSCIDQAGLKEVHRREIKEDVESFFEKPEIVARITTKTGFPELPAFQMSLQMIDYVLEKKLT
jgi:2-polyprenyl-3-methyl-5-hydroxy-6-metoxy-1,4-benzoquinol methylase